MQRCTNPKATSYPSYGGAGVMVCERWTMFENFLADMGERSEDTTLGRILDLGNYEVGNVFWMTMLEQQIAQHNKRRLSAFRGSWNHFKGCLPSNGMDT
jgi:hypothetical protein